MNQHSSIPFRPTDEQRHYIQHSVPAGKRSDFIRQAIQRQMDGETILVQVQQLIEQNNQQLLSEIQSLLADAIQQFTTSVAFDPSRVLPDKVDTFHIQQDRDSQTTAPDDEILHYFSSISD